MSKLGDDVRLKYGCWPFADKVFWSNRGVPDMPLHFGLAPKQDDYIQTYTGKHFYLINPTEDMIDIEDIAHALAMNCRFNGHVKAPISVAEHSVWVSNLVSQEHKLAGLMHDASEAYISDIASPFKPFLNNYKEIEDNIMKVIAKKYGFEYPLHPEVKDADMAQLKSEARTLFKTYPDWADEERYDTVAIGINPQSWDYKVAEANFINQFNWIKKEGL